MTDLIQLGPNKCSHFDCTELQAQVERTPFCYFHYKGGVLGNGETYEQYQIIEKDFIDFLNVVPYTPYHAEIHSPVLRDIILRACMQVEIFFKEWLIYICIYQPSHPAIKKYNEFFKDGNQKKEKSWEFKDYYFFSELLKSKSLYFKQKSITIDPFSSWTDKYPPEWWQAYNTIKHGRDWKSKSKLSYALNAVGGLFLLHCKNEYSRAFLKLYTPTFFTQTPVGYRLQFEGISTPIDSKRYLFKEVSDEINKPIELHSKEGVERDAYLKKRNSFS